ncbi:MAG: penicillin-binding protein activator [Gemmatimonadota bacterium]
MLSRRRLVWTLLACTSLSARGQVPATPLDRPAAAPAVAADALMLIVPGPETPFARVAEALREGFIAAHRIKRESVAVQVVETDASAAQAISALRGARDRGVRLAVGPLTRNAVNGVVEHGNAGLPVLLLNVPDPRDSVPASQLAFGLSVEDEARVLVQNALRDLDPGATPTAARRHVIVIGDSGLSRRAGAAFVAALRAAGQPLITLEYSQYGPDRCAHEIGKAPVTSIFLALNASDAAQLRARLPIDAPLYATSQINVAATEGVLIANDLEGVRFVDMPWLVDPERPIVSAYPRGPADYDAEMQRLYAFGIDAYRVAVEWLAGRTRFELDGVTGWLRVDRERGARVERTPTFAVFREGRVERSDALKEVTR